MKEANQALRTVLSSGSASRERRVGLGVAHVRGLPWHRGRLDVVYQRIVSASSYRLHQLHRRPDIFRSTRGGRSSAWLATPCPCLAGPQGPPSTGTGPPGLIHAGCRGLERRDLSVRRGDNTLSYTLCPCQTWRCGVCTDSSILPHSAEARSGLGMCVRTVLS